MYYAGNDRQVSIAVEFARAKHSDDVIIMPRACYSARDRGNILQSPEEIYGHLYQVPARIMEADPRSPNQKKE